MQSKRTSIFLMAVAVTAQLTVAAPLCAAPGFGTEATNAAVATRAAVAAMPDLAPAADVPGLGLAATPAVLDGARGGTGGSAAADLRGVVTGNSATSMATGANAIQAGSFAGASGIPIVIQNTGANVLIQNATVINLQFQ